MKVPLCPYCVFENAFRDKGEGKFGLSACGSHMGLLFEEQEERDKDERPLLKATSDMIEALQQYSDRLGFIMELRDED